MTRKAPAGAKHSGCLDHVAHPYPSSGWLCITTAREDAAWPASAYVESSAIEPDPAHGIIGRPAVVRVPRDWRPVDRTADMVAFADHVGAVAAAHRARELARPGPDGTFAGDRLCRKAGCSTYQNADGTAHHHPQGPGDPAVWCRSTCSHTPSCAPAPAAGPIVEEPAVKVARKRSTVVDYSAPMPAGFVAVDPFGALATIEEPAPVADPVAAAPEPIGPEHPAIVAAASEPVARVSRKRARSRHWRDVITRAAARTAMAAATPPAEPIVKVETPAPVAPVLAAVPAPVDGRPTCPRCGQTFRKSGAGLSWHLANRPDCAAARPSLTIAS